LNCPDASELQARIEARLGTHPMGRDSERLLAVQAASTSEGLVAELELRDANGQSLGKRRLSTPGFDCSTLMDAVVFAAVMAIDPDATLAAPNAPAVAARESVASNKAALGPAAYPAMPTPLPRFEPKPVPARTADLQRPLDVQWLGRLMLTQGLVPRIEPGLETGLDIALRHGWGIQGTLLAVAPGRFASPGGAQVQVAVLGASAVARYQLELSDAWLVEGLLGLAGGAFYTHINSAVATGTPWYGDIATRTGFGVQVAPHPRLQLESTVSGLWCLHRERFSTQTASWAQPFLGVAATLGVAVRLGKQ